MLEEIVIVFLISIFSAAILYVIARNGRKYKTYLLVSWAERDADIYRSLLESRKGDLIFPSKISARLPTGKISAALMIFALAFLTYSAYIAKASGEAQASLIIPGVTIKTRFGIIGIVIAIAYGVLIHEAAHAMSGILRGYEPKRTGIIAIGPFIIAYVSFEDEENIDADVAGAGVMANLIFGLIALLLIYLLAQALAPYATGVVVTSGPDSMVGKVIVAVNGITVHNVSEFMDIWSKIPSGSSVTLTFSDGTSIEIIKGSVRFGIANRYFSGTLSYITITIISAVFRSYVVNISLAIINILPIIGLDGSKVLHYYLREKLNEGSLYALLMSLTVYSIMVLLFMLSG